MRNYRCVYAFLIKVGTLQGKAARKFFTQYVASAKFSAFHANTSKIIC